MFVHWSLNIIGIFAALIPPRLRIAPHFPWQVHPLSRSLALVSNAIFITSAIKRGIAPSLAHKLARCLCLALERTDLGSHVSVNLTFFVRVDYALFSIWRSP